jgi:hypothetical protein
MADGVRQMRQVHAKLGSAMLVKGMQKINALDPKQLTVREAVAIIELGAKLERQGRGEADQTIDHRVGLVDDIGPRRTSDTIWTLLQGNPDLADTVDEIKTALEAADEAADNPKALGPGDAIDVTSQEVGTAAEAS